MMTSASVRVWAAIAAWAGVANITSAAELTRCVETSHPWTPAYLAVTFDATHPGSNGCSSRWSSQALRLYPHVGAAGGGGVPFTVDFRSSGHDLEVDAGSSQGNFKLTSDRRPAATTTLDFYPNGEGLEVDAPSDIAYSADGQYLLVPSRGKSPLPGAANFSVYDAADASFVRAFSLTYRPERMAVMSGQTRAVLLDPDDDAVTVVDFVSGKELAVIPVGDRPRAIAISPDDAIAVVQGGSNDDDALGDVPWSIIDLSANVESARLTGPDSAGIDAPGYFGSEYYVGRPIFLPDGRRVAALAARDEDGTSLDIAVLDTATLSWTSIPAAPAGDVTFGPSLAATPDGSTIAAPYIAYNAVTNEYEVHICVVDSQTLATTDHVVEIVPFAYYVELLIKPDASKIVYNGFNAFGILDTSDGTVVTADVSDFSYDPGWWWPVAPVADGSAFMAWNWGAGDGGYQIFDWTGAHVSELIANDLGGGDYDVFTQLLAVSPSNASQLAFVDPHLVGEDLVLLDLDPSNPHVLVHKAVGDDGIEGDGATKLTVSADQATGLVLNYQSSNLTFVDLPSMTHTRWIDTPKYVTDALLTPDGTTAIYIAGAPTTYSPPLPNGSHMGLVDRDSGGASEIALPANTYGRGLAMDSDGRYVYTLLATPGVDGTQLTRLDLTTQQLDATRLPIPGNLTTMPLITGFATDRVTLPAAMNGGERWASQSHDGSLLAIASNYGQGTVTLIDRNTWSVLTSISLAPSGFDQWAMEFSSDDTRLYVVSQSAISVIDIRGETSSLITQQSVGLLATGATLSPDDSKLYVGIWPVHLSTTYNVMVFDTVTLAPAATLTLPIEHDLGLPPNYWTVVDAPLNFRWSQDGSKLYVFSLNDEIHVIDPSSDQVVESYTTGFLSPSSVIELSNSAAGDIRFLMASFSGANDGLAIATISSDVLFRNGFE